MTCPHCGYDGNEETYMFVQRKDISDVDFEGFDEEYRVECDKCGKSYIHVEQYEIGHIGEKDRVE